ncbi:MAG: HEAT repeat domain-containing protein [Cyclobacteriaceae bacterium]|nr:HEAT repeat domain-containing protein [Cyclobacteriaceae bacterium]
MDKEKINELVVKYNEGQADPAELKQIELLLEQGVIELADLDSLRKIQQQFTELETAPPSAELDHQFYTMLSKMKRESDGFSWRSFFSWPEFAPKLALAAVTLFVGFFLGYILRPDSEEQVAILNEQVFELREMMMLSLLEKESATERLKAVSLTQEMDQVSSKVTNALIQTLDNDPNVNVRLSALEALKPYVRNDQVREKLVQSISKQSSPLVQVALAELMAALQEKSSVKALEKILESDSTPREVKKRIEESLKIMI